MPRFCFTRTCDLINNIRTWKRNQSIIGKLAGSGFDHFSTLEFPMNIKHCMPLLDVVVENYNVERRCFIFNSIPFVLSLKDILYITGFKIDGKPVFGLAEVDDPQAICARYLGRHHDNHIKPSLISLSWLRKFFEIVPPDLDEDSEEFSYYIRAYVLYLIGAVVAPTKDGSRVSVHYLVYLREIDKIKNFAWGATLLAHLHKCLEAVHKPKKNGQYSNSVAGSTYTLMCFVAEYIPSIASELSSGDTNPLPMQLPLMAGWAKKFNKACASVSENIAAKQKRNFSQILTSLKDENGNIEWNPYERLEDNLQLYYMRQERLALSRTVVICDQGVARHSPQEQPKQFGMASIDNMLKLIEETNGLTDAQQWDKRWHSLISDVKLLDVSDDSSRPEVENDILSDDLSGQEADNDALATPQSSQAFHDDPVDLQQSEEEEDEPSLDDGENLAWDRYTRGKPRKKDTFKSPRRLSCTPSATKKQRTMTGAEGVGADGAVEPLRRTKQKRPDALDQSSQLGVNKNKEKEIKTSVQNASDSSGKEILQPSPKRACTGHCVKKLLILDVNGILADIAYSPHALEKKIINKHAVFKRPHCEEFVRFCLEKFFVGIWSSRRNSNLNPILDYLVGDLTKSFLLTWDQRYCTEIKNGNTVLYMKELHKIWELYTGIFDQTNTLLVDDSPEKASNNPECNGLFPDPYYFEHAATDSYLGPDGELRQFLEGLAETDNLKKYVEEHRIGQTPCYVFESWHSIYYV